MANNPGAKKRIRQIERRTERNRVHVSRARTFIRKVEEAIASGDKTAAQEALRLAQPKLMSAVGKGVFHRNTASRKLSRLSARIKAIGA